MFPRQLAAVVTALVLSAGIGLLAGSFGGDQFWLRATVFALCTLGPTYGLGWLLFVAPVTETEQVARPEETVEHQWWERSTSAGFLDVVTVAGVGLFALSVTDLRVDASTVLVGLLLLAFADVAARFTVLRRRDA